MSIVEYFRRPDGTEFNKYYPGEASASGTASDTWTTTGLTPGVYTLWWYDYSTRVNSNQRTVTLTGTTCSYSLSPQTINLNAAAGSSSFQVTTSSGCTWTATTGSSWITLTSYSGNGSGTVSFNYSANTLTSSRTGSIAVGGQNVSVVQAGTSSGALPDLVVRNLRTVNLQHQTVTTVNPGDVIKFAFDVYNIGLGPTTVTQLGLQIYKDGSLFDSGVLTIPLLNPGVGTGFESEAWTATTGDHNVIVYADTTNLHSESNEQNNASQPYVFTVQSSTPAPSITSFTATPGTISFGAESTLSWATQNAVTVSIDQGLGVQQLVNGSKVVRPSVDTTYKLTATGADGRTATSSAKVQVRLGASLTGTFTSGTVPLESHFFTEVWGGVPPYTYTWSWGETKTQTIVLHTWTSPGSFDAWFNVTDSAGQTAQSNSVHIDAKAAGCQLSCTASTDPAGTQQEGRLVHFNGTWAGGAGCPQGPPGFEWDFGDGSPTTSQSNPTHAYTKAGTYDWKLTITLAGYSQICGGRLTVTPAADLAIQLDPATINFANVSTVANQFTMWADITDLQGKAIANVRGNYVVFLVDSAGKQVASAPVDFDVNGKRWKVPFTITSLNGPYKAPYFERALLKICNSSLSVCRTFSKDQNPAFPEMSVYGTDFDIEKHAFRFANSSWTNSFSGMTQDVYRAARTIALLLPSEMRAHFEASVGGDWDYFSTPSQGLCYGMAGVAISNFTHSADNLVWGPTCDRFEVQQGAPPSCYNPQPSSCCWATEVDSGWSRAIADRWSRLLQGQIRDNDPLPGENIYGTTYDQRAGWTLSAAEKIMHAFVSEPGYDSRQADPKSWYGKSHDGPYSGEDVKALLRDHNPVRINVWRDEDNGHTLVLTQLISWTLTDSSGTSAKGKFVLYDNNHPPDETRRVGLAPYAEITIPDLGALSAFSLAPLRGRSVEFIRTEDGTPRAEDRPRYGPFAFTTITPSYNRASISGKCWFGDSEQIYRHSTVSAPCSLPSLSASTGELWPEGLRPEHYQVETQCHRVFALGATQIAVYDASGAAVPLLSGGKVDGRNAVVFRSGISSVVFLPAAGGKKYRVELAKDPASSFLDVFSDVVGSDGTISKTGYERVAFSESDATRGVFYVGQNNPTLALTRVSGAGQQEAKNPDFTVNSTVSVPSVQQLQAFVTQGQVRLTWKNPVHPRFSKVRLVRKVGSASSSPDDGAVLFEGSGVAVGLQNSSFVDTAAPSGSVTYDVYSYDSSSAPTARASISVDTRRYCVTGFVRSTAGPVASSIVSASQGGRELFSAITDRDGRYTICDLLNGTYTIACDQASGSQTVTINGASVSKDFAPTCAPSATTLCLSRARIKAEVTWRSQYSGQTGAGYALPQGDGFGFFYFSDSSNPEVFVKVLDFGAASPYLLFYAGLTDFEYKVTFTNIETGKSVVFTKPAGSLNGWGDNTSLPHVSADGGLWDGLSERADSLPVTFRREDELQAADKSSPKAAQSSEDPTPDAAELLLSKGTVAVTVTYRNQYNGQTGTAPALPKGDQFGFFYFSDPGNPEVFVKVLDWGADKPYLLFYAGLTDFEYTVSFRQVQSGQVVSFKKNSGTYNGGADNVQLKHPAVVNCTSFTVSPNAVSAPSTAGSAMVNISGTPAGCAGGSWSSASAAGWLTVQPGGGTGPGSVTVSYQANPTSSQRQGSVTVAGQTVAVTQAGACSAPSAANVRVSITPWNPGNSQGILVEWDAVPGAVKYRVLRDGQQVYEGTDLKFTDFSILSATRYCYQVQVVVSCGAGPLSAPVCYTTGCIGFQC